MSSDSMDLTDFNVESYLQHAKTAIAGMSLTSVQLEDFLVVMNSKPDVMISEEPYFSHMILVEVKSGMYIRRIWNRTVERGMATNLDQLADLCNKHFFQGRPCVGCPLLNSEKEEEFAISQTPIPRRISKYCREVLSYDAGDEETTCQECLKLGVGSEYQTPLDEGSNCEVVIKSEPGEWEMEDTQHGINDEGMIEPNKQVYKTSPVECPISLGCGPQKLGKIRRSRSGKITYGELITEAITNSEMKMLPLSRIYEYITNKYPFFKMENRGWQNSIRHNLTLKDKFEKVPRLGGRGSWWVIKGGNHDIELMMSLNHNTQDIKKEEESEIEETEINDADVKSVKKEDGNFIIIGNKLLASCMQDPNHTKDIRNGDGVPVKFKCRFCEKGYPIQGALIAHAKRMHGLGDFKCGECTFQALYVSEMVNHSKQEHQIESQEIECPICKSSVEVSAITEHYEECLKGKWRGMPVECKWCGKVSKSKASLWLHEMAFHGRGKFVCPYCQAKASYSHELIKHMRLEDHGTNRDISCPSCKISISQNEIVAHYEHCFKSEKKRKRLIEKIECKTCGKICNSNQAYKSHIKMHMRAEGVNESETNMKLYHYCDKCDMRFINNTRLTDHIRNVHDKIDLTCPECPMTFKTSGQLYRHKNLAHSQDDRFECKYCGKRFSVTAQVRAHERVHEDAKFQCRFCSKMLKSERSLKAHERYHTGEANYLCKLCNKAFTSKSRLSNHEQGVHKIIGPQGGTGWLRKKKIDEI